jgi:phage minor structural protein
MVNSIFILNKDKNIIDVLSNNGDFPRSPFFDDEYTQDLATGAETYDFYTLGSCEVEVGQYVAFKIYGKVKMFQVVEIEEEHQEPQVIKHCYCETAGLELANNIVRATTMPNVNVRQFMTTVLNGTPWQLGMVDLSASTVATVEIDKPESVYTAIQDNLSVFDVEIEYRVEMSGRRVVGQYIDVFAQRGAITRKRFEYGENVSNVSKNIDISNLATALIGLGKGGITFKSVEWLSDKPTTKPLNQDFVVDPEAYQQWNRQGEQLLGIYENTECESPAELLLLTWKELQNRKVPTFTYDVDIEMIQGDEKEIELGDTVYVIDNDYTPALHLEARVGQITLSFTDHTKNSCILTNYKDVKSGILSLDTIQGIIDGKFPVGSEEIADGAITEGKINQQYLNQIKADFLQATVIDVDKLVANKANVEDLEAVKASIGELEANKASIDQLNAKFANVEELVSDRATLGQLEAMGAEIETLIADKATISQLEAVELLVSGKADISDLNSTNATISTLKSNLAEISTIVNGNITSDNIQAGGITSDKLTIANGFITNAMIENVSASKLTAGTLDTNKIEVKSDTGNLLIKDNTIQIKDDTRVRAQMGKDATGDYSLSVWDSQGQLMFDARGLTEDGIKSEIIRNDMISPNANIDGGKLNINSVIQTINEEGTETLKSSLINLDSSNQTLDVAFGALSNSISETQKEVLSNSTALGVQQGQINTLISNTQIVENGSTILLKDKYSSLDQTVAGISATIGSQTSEISDLKTSVSTNSSSIKTLEGKIALKVEQSNIDSALTSANNYTNTKVAEISATQDSILLKVEGAEKTASTALTTANSNTTNINTLSSKVATVETNLTGITSRVSSVETAQTTADSNITNLQSRMSSAESKITSTAIVNTVKSSTTDGNKTFALYSDITQLDNSWTATFNAGYSQGIVSMDSTGITVSSTDINTKTKMDASSFRVEDNKGGTVAEFATNTVIPTLSAGTISANTIIANNLASKSAKAGDVKTIYVNGSTGNDSSNDGTSTYPYKTVQRAISDLSDKQDQSVNINIANSVPGFELKGMSGTGIIQFALQDSAIISGQVIFGGITNAVKINSPNQKGTFKNGILVYRCMNMEFYGLAFRGANSSSCNIYLKDVNYACANWCDFGGLDTVLTCAIKTESTNLWLDSCKGSNITDVVGMYAFSCVYMARGGTKTVPDYTNGLVINYDGGGRVQNWGGATWTKTASNGWNPSYTATSRTTTWSFDKIWSDETLNGWSDREELIQGYASTWSTGRWTGYIQMADGMAGIKNAISGGSNYSGRIYIQRTSSGGLASGSKLCLYASDGTAITTSTSISRGEGVWVSLSSSIITKIANGTITYFYLQANTNNTATYIKCESNCKIEITYTK